MSENGIDDEQGPDNTADKGAGAGQLVGGRPGMSVGLSEQKGRAGKLEEGEQSKGERIRSWMPALSRTRSHKQLVERWCGYSRH